MENVTEKLTRRADDPLDELTIIRQASLARAFGVSRQTLWRMVHRGELPEPITVSEGVKGWRLSTLREWIDARETSAGAA